MNYPLELRRRELAAITTRRQQAHVPATGANPPADLTALPDDTVGLALSGGGIRSATVCLGVLQSMARKNRLRQIDFLSSVSGGGYAASFLGRLFTRFSPNLLPDACGRVQSILSDDRSPQIQWLRMHSDYIFSDQSDLSDAVGALWRNLFSIFTVFAFLAAAAFGLAEVVGDHVLRWFPSIGAPPWVSPTQAVVVSHWWPLPLLIAGLGVVPCTLAYWLSPIIGTRASFSFYPLTAWLVFLIGLGFSLAFADASLPCALAIVVLLVMIVWLEGARFNLPKPVDRSAGAVLTDAGAVMRNRLNRALGSTLFIFVGSIAWVLIDTLAQAFALGALGRLVAGWLAITGPAMVFLRDWVFSLSKEAGGDAATKNPGVKDSVSFKSAWVAFPLLVLTLVVLDGCSHWLFNHNAAWGWASLSIGAALSVVLGRAFHFLNFSSLQTTYGGRLCRAFLGASNPARIGAESSEGGGNVLVTEPGDDLNFDEYHPEREGGPIHLINVCINETLDAASEREIRDRKGLSMCVGPCGVSVGRKFHSVWCPPPRRLSWKTRVAQRLKLLGLERDQAAALKPLSLAADSFHVLKGKTDAPIVPEPLSIAVWTSISGAAFGTGAGKNTSLPLSLLCGLLNVRLGYWWNSGLSRSDRPGQFKASIWRQLKRLPDTLIEMQSVLLDEFQGRFSGPSQRLWNLSDGGHFDNTGIYELVRRRVPLIIAVDVGQDADYGYDDIADLVRLVHVDFGATIEFVDPATAVLPAWVKARVQVPNLGTLSDIRRVDGKKHAALAQIKYLNQADKPGWLVLLKSSLTGDESVDVAAYHHGHPEFPQESTTDQFFTDSQWESYRRLGEHIADLALT